MQQNLDVFHFVSHLDSAIRTYAVIQRVFRVYFSSLALWFFPTTSAVGVFPPKTGRLR